MRGTTTLCIHMRAGQEEWDAARDPGKGEERQADKARDAGNTVTACHLYHNPGPF